MGRESRRNAGRPKEERSSNSRREPLNIRDARVLLDAANTDKLTQAVVVTCLHGRGRIMGLETYIAHRLECRSTIVKTRLEASE